MTRPAILALALALAAVVSGCGGSKANTSSSAPSSTITQSSTAQPSPAASAGASPSASGQTVALVTTKHAKLGTILAAGQKRLTVYIFASDRGSTSACSGACAKVWPPLTTSAVPRATLQARLASLGTTTRADGTKQVTYKGHPLYLYARDKDDGDAYGQGLTSFGAGWYVLTPSGKKIDNS